MLAADGSLTRSKSRGEALNAVGTQRKWSYHKCSHHTSSTIASRMHAVRPNICNKLKISREKENFKF